MLAVATLNGQDQLRRGILQMSLRSQRRLTVALELAGASVPRPFACGRSETGGDRHFASGATGNNFAGRIHSMLGPVLHSKEEFFTLWFSIYLEFTGNF